MSKRPRCEDMPSGPTELVQCSAAHEAWTAAFVDSHGGRRPGRSEIDADAIAAANAARMRELTIAAAAPFVEGQCQYFVWRKKRFCASRAAHAAACFCSDHDPAKLAQLQADSLAGNAAHLAQAGAAAAAGGGGGSEGAAAPGGKTKGGRGVKTNQERNPKRMTNPLSKQFQEPVPAPDWAALYAQPARPLLLDIGCARGRFLQELALRRPESYNYCGVEIFAPIVVAANEWVAAQQDPPVRHLHFIAANINCPKQQLMFPNVRLIALQFPDPWHAKHGKRRVMSPAFATQIASLLPDGGLFYFCSDHVAIATHIRECMLGTDSFEAILDDDIDAAEASDGLLWGGGKEVTPDSMIQHLPPAAAVAAEADSEEPAREHLAGQGEKSKCRSGDVTPATARGGATEAAAALPSTADGFLKRSPFPVPTERDRVCELKWRPVWRMLLRRKTQD